MKIKFKKLIFIFAAFALFLSAGFCQAAFLREGVPNKIRSQTESTGRAGGYELSGDVYGLAQIVINAFLSIVGVLLLIYLLYAGYHWMTARGEEEKVEKAKDTITRAIIGAIIIIAAYAISIFVMSRLEAGTLRGGGGTTPPAVSPTPSPSPVDNGAEYYKTDGYAG